MPSPRTVSCGLVSDALPTPVADDTYSSDQPVRIGRYRELWTPQASPNDFGYAFEGSYLQASNATVGTGATFPAAVTSFSDTTFNWFIANLEPAGGRSIAVKFLKLITTAVATTATLFRYAGILDVYPRAITTDNTLTIVPTCPNSGRNPVVTPIIKVQNSSTASVIAASTSAKRIAGNGMLGGLNVVGTTMQVNFGQCDAGGGVNGVAAETIPNRRVDNDVPVIIAPGWCWALSLWAVGSSASPAPEWTIGMIAR